MKRILQCIKDTYITNRIIGNFFRAVDANVGNAGTLDLFKLAGESTISSGRGPYVSGTNDPIELSRILLKFDLDPLRELTGSILDLNDSNFKCELSLSDVLGGQTLPSNFKIIAYPLSQSFDEGIGRDVSSFEDIGAANYVTASIQGDTVSTWFLTGANEIGYSGQENIDIISGSAETGDVFVVQEFPQGSEDLLMDVTKIVSATLVGLIPDHGIRLSFSGTQETDNKTRFVKRFASRHAQNTRIRPKLTVKINDSVQDNHEDFFFDLSGSLFLRNYHRGQPSNIITSNGSITGSNSLLLTLTSGSISGTYSQTVSASQYSVGNNFITGIYKADLSIPSNNQFLSGEILSAHSATFVETWTSLDGFEIFLRRNLVVNSINRSTFAKTLGELKLNITNMKSSFKSDEKIKFRVFAQDDQFDFKYTRLPLLSKSEIFNKVYWQIRDKLDDSIIMSFDDINNSTRLSTDSEGMYFDFYMKDLDVGRVYSFDVMIDFGGIKQVFNNVGGSFRVEF